MSKTTECIWKHLVGNVKMIANMLTGLPQYYHFP